MQAMKTYILPYIGSLILSLLSGIICGVLGSFLVSLAFPNFIFGSLVGYEAGGVLFLLFGLIAGGTYGTRFLTRYFLKTVFQKPVLSFVLALYIVSAFLWFIFDTLHLPNETHIVSFILAWIAPPVFVLYKGK